MKTLESNLQSACVKWFRLQYPKHTIFAIPNGSLRNIVTAVRLRNEGVLRGVADLFLCTQTKKFHGLFIEMKIKPNKQSQEQIEFEKNVLKQGYDYAVCYTFEDFQQTIKEYLK